VLGYLTYENSSDDRIKFSGLAITSIFLYALSAMFTFCEILVLRINEIYNVNLEMRVKLRSDLRMTDLFRVASVSILVTSMAVLIGMSGFENEGCVADHFNENSICKSCRDFVNPLCSSCTDRFSCDTCDPGFYPIDQSCLDCKAKDPNCLACDSQGCSRCQGNMFISAGQCTSCFELDGCRPGKCSDENGCSECLPGYYLDDGKCKICSLALSGCKQCRNSDVCTMCASEFLTIESGRCICRRGEKNQAMNLDTGACECNEGFYMTETGCQTCDYMIPGC